MREGCDTMPPMNGACLPGPHAAATITHVKKAKKKINIKKKNFEKKKMKKKSFSTDPG